MIVVAMARVCYGVALLVSAVLCLGAGGGQAPAPTGPELVTVLSNLAERTQQYLRSIHQHYLHRDSTLAGSQV